jgi:hypothetical protein
VQVRGTRAKEEAGEVVMEVGLDIGKDRKEEEGTGMSALPHRVTVEVEGK